MTSTPMEEMNNYNSQWVSFHIRDHLKDGEITVQNTVIEGYRSLPGLSGIISLSTNIPSAVNSTARLTVVSLSTRMRLTT